MHIDTLPDHRRNLVRWSELAADPALARLPFRIETDRLGRIIMSPPPHFDHTWRAAKINRLLREYLPQGEVLGETPLSTSDGVKVMDLAWVSAGYAQLLEAERPVALVQAPEICIEVFSPSNTAEEIAEKRALYFEAGAKEVWICELDGRMSFYCRGELMGASELCGQFPKQL
jgi:Uma2 family endonuclease